MAPHEKILSTPKNMSAADTDVNMPALCHSKVSVLLWCVCVMARSETKDRGTLSTTCAQFREGHTHTHTHTQGDTLASLTEAGEKQQQDMGAMEMSPHLFASKDTGVKEGALPPRGDQVLVLPAPRPPLQGRGHFWFLLRLLATISIQSRTFFLIWSPPPTIPFTFCGGLLEVVRHGMGLFSALVDVWCSAVGKNTFPFLLARPSNALDKILVSRVKAHPFFYVSLCCYRAFIGTFCGLLGLPK